MRHHRFNVVSGKSLVELLPDELLAHYSMEYRELDRQRRERGEECRPTFTEFVASCEQTEREKRLRRRYS